MTRAGQRPEDDAKRPRVADAREREVLEAALRVLCETGYEAMTMDMVARRARCSKATLYRRWGSRSKLVTAAIIDGQRFDAVTADGADLREDLLDLATILLRYVDEMTALVVAVGRAALSDPDVGDALRISLVEPVAGRLRDIVSRSVGRGELHAEEPANVLLPHLFLSAAFSPLLVDGRSADMAFMTRWIDGALVPALLNSQEQLTRVVPADDRRGLAALSTRAICEAPTALAVPGEDEQA